MTVGPIAFDARAATPHFPGIGRTIVGLANALAAGIRPPQMVILHNDRPHPGLPLSRWPMQACRTTPFDLGQQWEIRVRLRRAAASMYHSPYYLMPYAPGVPAVVTCNDLIPLTVPGLFSPPARAGIRIAHAMAFRAASVIVVPSRATHDDVARLFPRHAGKLEVVPHGWDSIGDIDEVRAARLRHELGVHGRYILAVGSNKPHKNLQVLVEAWATVAGRFDAGGTATALVLAGPRDPRFPDGGSTGERLAVAGRMVSVGPVSDETLAALYGGATLLVCPSRAEGFGLPVAEAMGLGVPVVCSRAPALVEVAGCAGAHFDSDDPGGLARLIERLLGAPDEREAMRHAGFTRAAELTWARAAERMSTLYARVAGGLA